MKTTKKILMLMLAVALVLGLAACSNSNPPAPDEIENPVIRLSTTTSVNDSGLLSYLQPVFESDTGYILEISSAGSGAAIEKGRTGDADCLLTHSASAEQAFIDEGYNEERVVFMHNFFVIVGPPDDPAGVEGSADASEAFTKIAETPGAIFVSRGDNSGTHVAEGNIWAQTDVDPEGQDWYVSVGQGMGASLNVASEMEAYILTDKATYLAHDLRDTMAIHLEKSDQLINIYALIAISPERYDDTNAQGAEAFIAWMTSPKALGMINEFGVAEYGEGLFFAD